MATKTVQLIQPENLGVGLKKNNTTKKFDVDLTPLVDGTTTTVQGGKLNAKQYDDTAISNRLTTVETKMINPATLSAELDPRTSHVVVVDTSKPEKPDQGIFDQSTGQTIPVTGGEMILDVDLFNLPHSVAFQTWWDSTKQLQDLENESKFQPLGEGGATQPLTAAEPLKIEENQISLNFDPNYFVNENSKLRPIGSLSVGGGVKRLANLELVTTGVGRQYDGSETVRPELTDIVRTFQGHIFISASATGVPVDAPDEWVRMGTRRVDIELIPFSFYFNGLNIVDADIYDHYIQRAYLKDDNNNVIGIFSRTTKRDIVGNRQVPLGQKTEENWTNWVRLDTPETANAATVPTTFVKPLRQLADGRVLFDYNQNDFEVVNAGTVDLFVAKSPKSWLVSNLSGKRTLHATVEDGKKITSIDFNAVFTNNKRYGRGEAVNDFSNVKFKITAPADVQLEIDDWISFEEGTLTGSGTNEVSFVLTRMDPGLPYQFPVKVSYPESAPVGTSFTLSTSIDLTNAQNNPNVSRKSGGLTITVQNQ